jgi:hypothetical protein
MKSNVKLGQVNIPLIPILLAVPKAIKAVRKVASDNRDADSPGGEKVTAAEVMEALSAFAAALIKEVADDVLAANGVK